MNSMKLATVFGLGIGFVAACGDGEKPCDPSNGTICTIAGTGENGYEGEDGPALDAKLSLPIDTLFGNGQLYVLDWNNHRVRRISMKDMYIHFVVGNGELGGSIDDPATGQLNHPTNLIWDANGQNMYLAAWHNSKIRTIDPSTGEVIDTCGDGRRAYFGDGGPALMSSLDLPAGLALSPSGNLTVLDQANQVIRQVNLTTNTIDLVAGRCIIDGPVESGGPGKCASGVDPVKCPAPSGKWTCGDPAMTCTKPCWPGYTGDDIPATQMRMSQVFGQSADPGGRIAYDAAGNLYFADVQNQIIRMIDTSGIVHRVAGTAPVDGVAQSGYAGDGGAATDALLFHPVDLEFADDGTLYFSDVYNHCIRSIDPAGVIHTVVGTCGKKGYDGDGGDAAKALLNRPYGIEWVAPNTLYIADTGNSVIRVVNLK